MNGERRDKAKKRPLSVIGALLGAKTGLVFSALYMVGLMFLLLIVPIIPSPIGRINPGTITPTVYALLVGLGMALGVLPAVTLGTLTGTILGIITSRFHSRLTSGQSTRLGICLCLVIAIIINLAILPRAFVLSYPGVLFYVYWLLIPSLIYVVAGGRIAVKLYQEVNDHPK